MRTVKTITVPVYGLNVATCGRIIEQRLGMLPGVARADASYVSQTVTITYDEHRISEETLRDLVRECGFACGEPMTPERMLQAAAETERGQNAPAGVLSHAAPSHALVVREPVEQLPGGGNGGHEHEH